MTITLRTHREQEVVERLKPVMQWRDEDYAVVDDDTRIGRIYRTRLPAGVKWMWFLQVSGAPLPDSGTASTLEQAKAAIAANYAIANR